MADGVAVKVLVAVTVGVKVCVLVAVLPSSHLVHPNFPLAKIRVEILEVIFVI